LVVEALVLLEVVVEAFFCLAAGFLGGATLLVGGFLVVVFCKN